MWMLGFTDELPPPDSDRESSGDDAAVREEISAALVNILPWGVSVVVHTGLVVLAIFVVWTTYSRGADRPVIIPIAQLSVTPGTPLEVSESQRLETTRLDRRVLEPGAVDRPAPARVSVDVPRIVGLESAAGAQRVDFGSPLDVDSRFRTSFFGSGGNARRIAFLVDATGSLIDTFPHVVDELKRTVQRLDERQQFTIIFFTGAGPIEVLREPGLKPATPAIKARVIEWIDIDNHNVRIVPGRETPVAALRQALRYEPELIFLLSDNITGQGQYETHQQRLLQQIADANTAETRINTIQFVYRDPLEKAGMKGTMQLIAEQSGGRYKFIDAEELNLQ